MSTVRKRSLIKNIFFSVKKRAEMQKYLNRMSQNGYHLKSIGRFSCAFTDDETVRYIYRICPESEISVNGNNSEWEKVAVKKGAVILKKEIPDNAVSLTRSFGKKNLSSEAAWLGSLLAKGLVLTGKTGNEYIFSRSRDYADYRYIIVDEKDYAPSEKLKFLAHDERGKIYLIKSVSIENRVRKMRGKNLPDLMLSFLMALGGAVCLAVSLIFFGFRIASLISSGKNSLPFVIAGAVLAVISLIVMLTGYFRFRRISELRRIMKEERLALQRQQQEKKEPSPQPESKPETKNNNTVVMNTVVMNNYGKRKKGGKGNDYEQPETEEEFDEALDNVFDGNYTPVNTPDNPALDEENNPALMYWKDPKELTKKLIKAYSGDKTVKKEKAASVRKESENIIYAEKADSDADDGSLVSQTPDSTATRDRRELKGKSGLIIKSLLILLSVTMFSFSLRYVVRFFAEGAKSGYLLLVLALIAIAVTVIATIYLTGAIIWELKSADEEFRQDDIYSDDDRYQ